MDYLTVEFLLITCIVPYAIGSVSFAIILGKLHSGIDIRQKGSGNAGTTNVYRVLGWKAGITVLLLDIFKGFLPVFFISQIAYSTDIGQDIIQIAVMTFLLIGHAFPLWHGFKGGKGIAVFGGGAIAISPLVAGIALLVFIAVVWATSYVSLGSLVGVWLLPIAYALIHSRMETGFSLAILIIYIILPIAVTVLHRKNIVRLVRGQESKFKLR